ncbi:MAG: MnhB domain-containing protein [Ilumatobacteraceae bacterium]
MSRPAFLEPASRVIFHAVIVGSVYLLFAGHNQPGGGFVGGLVAGAAIALRYLTGGITEVRAISRFQPWTILGAGITLAVATAIAPMFSGKPVMTSMAASLDPPLFGHIAASTTLVFDAGVYLAVVGLVFMVFEAFADEHATAADLAARDARDDGAPS